MMKFNDQQRQAPTKVREFKPTLPPWEIPHDEHLGVGPDLETLSPIRPWKQTAARPDSPEPAKVDRRGIKRVLVKAGYEVVSAEPLPNAMGLKFVLKCGAVIPVYCSGKFVV